MKKRTIYSVFSALLSGQALCIHLGLHEREFLFFLIAVGLFLMFRFAYALTDKRIKKISLIIGALFALFYTMYTASTLYSQLHSALKLTVCFVGLWILFSTFLEIVFNYFSRKGFALNSQENITTRGKCIVFFGCLLLICVWFIFWLLLLFPGSMGPDSFYQLTQVVGIEPLNNDHPILTTLLLRAGFNFGLKLFDGNQNNAIAFCSACQAFLMAVCYSFFFETLYISGLRKKHIAIVLLMFFFTAYHGIYSVTLLKDTLFAGWTLAFSCTLWRIVLYYQNRSKGFPKLETIVFFVVGMLFCLFRKNGYYSFLICIPFLFAFFVKKSPVIPFLSLGTAILIFLINGPVLTHFGIASSDTAEFVGVPFQHIARAIVEGAELTDEEYEQLSKVFDIEEIPKIYSPSCVDAVKHLIRAGGNQSYLTDNLPSYFKIWLKLGIRYPSSYLRAHIDLTKGYWYPDATVWFVVTGMNGMEKHVSNFEICQDSIFPDSFRSWSESAWIQLYKLPLFALSSSLGAGFFVTIMAFGQCIINKKRNALIVFVPVLVLMAGLIMATPVDAEFRYAYGMFTTLPLLCVIPFIPLEKKIGENDG